MTFRLRQLRRHALFAVVLAAILVGSLSGAGAETAARAKSDAHTTASGTAALRRVAAGGLTPDEKKYGIPANRFADGDGQTPYGGPVSRIPVDVGKSKAELTVPPTTVLGYIRVCIGQPLGPGVPAFQSCCPDAIASTCKGDDAVKYPATSVDDTAQPVWARTDAPIWIKSPRGARKQYGVFPPVTVRLLAFGAVPATATIHLEQPTGADGLTRPLQFKQLILTGPQGFDAGGNGFPLPATVAGYPLPQPTDGAAYNFWQTNAISGPVDVRIDNLTVDGHRVNVGTSCRTGKPATLSYNGLKGWVNQALLTSKLYGGPGEFNPLGDNNAATGTAPVTVKVPSFVGCRDGRRSLDPLVTALASGSGNRARISLAAPIVSCRQVPGGEGYPCPHYPGDPLLQAAQTATAQSAGGTEAVTASAVHRIVRVVRKLPARTRIGLELSLPVHTRAAVLQALR